MVFYDPCFYRGFFVWGEMQEAPIDIGAVFTLKLYK